MKTKEEILSWLLTHAGVESEYNRNLIYNTLVANQFELTDEEIKESIPYPKAISKHQTDQNIGWIHALKFYRERLKSLIK
jgi:hypothetical protein